MIFMLPLETPTPEILSAMKEKGISEDSVYALVSLDLHVDGNYGESWLIADRESMTLHCFSSHGHVSEDEKYPRDKKTPPAVFDYHTAYDMRECCGWYVDNFVSSNRFLARKGAPFVPDPELDEKENRERETAYGSSLETFVIAFCTNAKKKRLFAFIDIIERLQQGEILNDDDPLFDQFNLKCPKCGRVYKDQERKICEYCSNNSAVFRRLVGYCADYKGLMITVIVCMLLTSGISLITPILNGKVLFDQVITPPNADGTLGQLHGRGWVFGVVGIIFGTALLSLLINIIQNRANHRLSARVTQRMKMDVFTALQTMSLSYFSKNPTGRLVHHVNNDAAKVRQFFIDGVPNLVINSLNFIGLTVLLFGMNAKLTLIVFIPVPIIVLIFRFALPRLWNSFTKQWKRNADLNSMLNDSLSGVRVVKAFAKETDETHRFRFFTQRCMDTSLVCNKIHLSIFPVISLLIAMSSKAIWGFGGIEVMGNRMTYGEFTTYFGYLGMIFGPLNFFTNFTNLMTDVINSAQRMFGIMDTVPEICDSPDAVTVDPLRGEVEFRRICFHYAPNRPILKDVSFKIEAGQHVGLVGHTGSGKSTIANLITRLYDVISGSVLIDGVNVKELSSESLRKGIAIVSQEIFLFRGTIADNIRYAKPDATIGEVMEAAKAANAHDFIMSLPDGYETVVGIGSRSLSGGEKQRISIARALLLDPPILILDEATAAMDTETERQIQYALERLGKGRTTISIAHRLSTLRDCDFLMVVDNGCVTEMGTHSELIEKHGTYYRLYRLQAESMKRVLQGM